MLFSVWAWNVICAPDVFTWNFAFMLMNLAQVFHILYQLRPVKFDPELEEAYHTLFEPFKVSISSGQSNMKNNSNILVDQITI